MSFFDKYFQQQNQQLSIFDPRVRTYPSNVLAYNTILPQGLSLGQEPSVSSAPMVLKNRPVEPGIYRIDVALPEPIPFEKYYSTQGTFDLGRDDKVGKCGVWIRGHDGKIPEEYIPNFEKKLSEGYDPTTEQNVEFYRSYTNALMNADGLVTGFYFYMFLAERWEPPAGLTPPIDIYFDQNGNVVEEISSTGAVITVDGLGFLLTATLAGILVSLVAATFVAGGLVAQKLENKRLRAVARIISQLPPSARAEFLKKHLSPSKPDKTGSYLKTLSLVPWILGGLLVWKLLK